MGGKSVRKSWNASDIEKIILRERKKRESGSETEKDRKSLVDAFV
jgi:hypothetical protein